MLFPLVMCLLLPHFSRTTPRLAPCRLILVPKDTPRKVCEVDKVGSKAQRCSFVKAYGKAR